MHIFLSFLFSPSKLKKYVRPEWIKIFDHNYVDKTVIQGLLANKLAIDDTLNKIAEYATGMAQV